MAGALSVPSAWAGAPSMSSVAAALPTTGAGAVPAARAGSAMPPVANMTGRAAVGGDTPRFELRPTVIPRFPAGG